MTSVEYRVVAYNTARESENKIHDDLVARRLGFRGALVPGVDVYAYLTHPIVERWGLDWLQRGTVSARFFTPVYEGDDVVVVCSPGADGSLELEARNTRGDRCAGAHATLPPAALAPPDPAHYPPAFPPAERPPASPASLVGGAVLGSLESGFHATHAPAYLADVRESLPLYQAAGIAHPGYLLRGANYILAANVTLGPWIHTGSDVRNFDTAHDGDRVATRGRVARVYEKKGHRFVDLDLLIVANGTRPIAQVYHTAIYEPRAR